MKADVILKKKEDAVSPVIGVMLMLVVTIVIAAVVAAFAGGLGSDVEMAPTAALNIDVYAGDNTVKIEHLSGEAPITKDITIKVTDVNGTPKGTGDLYDSNPDDEIKGYTGLSFTPSSTAKVTLTGDSLPDAGDFVTVTVLANGKHIVAKKDVVVKA